MDTVNAHSETLVTEIINLLNILLHIFADDMAGTEHAETAAHELDRYMVQVDRITTAAEEGEFYGLHNICVLFQEALSELAARGTPLRKQECVLLERWPTLVEAYLEASADLGTATAIVEHLQHAVWSTPLSAEDAALLVELLGELAVNEDETAEEFLPDDTAADMEESSLLNDNAEQSLVEGAQEPQEHAPVLTAETVDPAYASTASGDGEEVTSGDLEDTVCGEPDDVGADGLDETAKELVNLLVLEVSQIAESLETDLTHAASEDCSQVCTDLSEELERLGEAAEALGLEGIQRVCTHIRSNILHLLSQEEAPGNDQRQVMAGWPAPVLSYLQEFRDLSQREALVQYLQDPRWPQPLSPADGATLLEALVVTHIDAGEEEEEPRPRHAQLEDIALTIPKDVSPELLDGLLQDLPRQAADFSAAVQRLTSGEGTLVDMDAAQRVAHTLKGAANTVGVAGIANLTHHLEDILLTLAKHEMLPTQALNHTLIEAADCLEAMSETLCGLSEPQPEEERLGVLQAVLDWANLIDREGIPSDTTRPQARETLPGLAARSSEVTTATPQTDVAQEKATAAAATSGARVHTDLVDELLRLAGEAMILNGQLRNRLEHAMQQMGAVRAQNTSMQQLVLDLERLIDIRGITSPLLQRAEAGEFDPLEMEQYNELHTVSRRLMETMTDASEMGHEAAAGLLTLHDLLIDQRKLQQENEETIMRTRMVPVKTVAPRLQRSVRQTCRLTGKEAELVLSGGETLIDSNVLSSLIDPLMHMLRNAVDHGIEAPEARQQGGKPTEGTIALDFAREGNTIVVRCHDDGAGLDYASILSTALERGLINENQSLSNDELSRLILHPGFSTRSQTTQVSGRGIGMDAVYSRVQELKGALELTSEAAKGCLVELRLPVSLMSTHGLLVQAGKQVFAISNRGVEQILYPGAGTLSQMGDKTTYQIGKEVYEATSLETLLHLTPGQPHEQLATQPALVVREESGRCRVIFIQHVMDSLSLVVKNLGRYIPALKGVIGATIFGDGSIAPVLDLLDLLRRPARAYTASTTPEVTIPASEGTAPVALVVDDSLSARRALAEFVRDLGFEVHTASDGLDAIAVIEHTVPDLLLVDLEMPRMNGLELTAHVRNRDTTAHVPVIMITSRSTEKHRYTAAQAGANTYLVKPFAEDELAQHIQQLMALRGAA